jgi:hypothetical protein
MGTEDMLYKRGAKNENFVANIFGNSTKFLCVHTIQYDGDAPNPYGGSGAAVILIGFGSDSEEVRVRYRVLY